MSIIAMDLGGTKLASALGRNEQVFQYDNRVFLNGLQGEQVGALIVKEIGEKIKQAQDSGDEIRAVGICVPGIFRPEKGTVWVPNIPGWEDYPLYDEIREVISNKKIPVIIEGDRACYVLGEAWKGNAQNAENVVFIAVGTGIGAGIICDGRLLKGENDITGAAGWLALKPPYERRYDGLGCFEYHASGGGLARKTMDLLKEGEIPSLLKDRDMDKITSRDVFEAYGLGDPLAIKVIDEAVEFWGMAAANFISIFNPKRVIFGGGLFGPAKEFLPRIRREALKWAQPISSGQVEIKESLLGGEAGLTGAAFQAWKALEKENKGVFNDSI